MSIVVRILSLGWVTMMMILSITNVGDGAISQNLMEQINIINNEGPYLGIVINNNLLRNSLLQSSRSVPHATIPFLDFAGRRFHIEVQVNQKVISVVSGVGMLNAGITTQLLINIFNIEGVIQFGLSGSADPQLQIADVIIPHYWAHSGLWYWQRHGDGPSDELAFESIGDFTRKIGYLNISEYETNPNYSDNLLNNLWYQPEEIYSTDGEPDNRQHAFWVPVDEFYYSLFQNQEDSFFLRRCVNSTTCLPRPPKLVRVERGMSANVFVDNVAYRDFLHSKFNATLFDMESAAVALVCLQQKTPFIAIKAISDLAGDASSVEGSVFSSLAVQNALFACLQFMSLLPEQVQTLNSAQ